MSSVEVLASEGCGRGRHLTAGGGRKPGIHAASQVGRGHRGPHPSWSPALGFPCSGAPAGQAPWPTVTPTSPPASPPAALPCVLRIEAATHHFLLGLEGPLSPLPRVGGPGCCCWLRAGNRRRGPGLPRIRSPAALRLRCGCSPSLMCCPRGPGTRVWPGRAHEGLLLGLLGEGIPFHRGCSASCT